VSQAAALAFAAALAGVAAAWEALALLEAWGPAAGLARVARPLARAGSEGRAPTAAERRRLGVVAGGGLLFAGWLLGGPVLAGCAALAGPAVVLAVVRVRRRRYRAALAGGAAEAARALADGLAAGRSVRGALSAAASTLGGAAGHELRRAARALAMGEGTEPVLERLRSRAASPGWDAIVAAVLLQRDAGGDLAGLLRELADSLEAAGRLERDAQAATAQARFTAWLVTGLPIGAAVLAELASPGLAASVVREPLSAWMAGAAVLLQAIALVSVRRLARPPA
jgi:tight adherence protein B